MTDRFKYTPFDIARHVLSIDETADFAPEARNFVSVGEVVAAACAVGYGGHYDEVLEDHEEGETMERLADLLGPLYGITHEDTLELLDMVRTEWVFRLRSARTIALDMWRDEGWYTELHPTDLDACAACGRRIQDHDEAGCEDQSGQRWCVEHALEALAAYRSGLQ